MTKMTDTKKRRKGILPARRNLSTDELTELRGLKQLATTEAFKADLVKQNTALVTDGQKYAEQMQMTARLCEQYLQRWMQQKFNECGYAPGTPVSVDLATGILAEGTKPPEQVPDSPPQA